MKRNFGPPQFFLRFFRWFCDPELHKYIEGDLIELYNERITAGSKRKADLRFIADVLLLFRPGIIRPVKRLRMSAGNSMYKSNIRIGWRNLIKNKTFSFINVSGLSLGLTCSILIALWVKDEYSIDAFHENVDRIYVVTSCEYSGNETNGSYDTPGHLGKELQKELPEVEYSCSYSGSESHTFAFKDKRLKMRGNFAGPDLFKMFSYPLIAGSKSDALSSPESISISRTMANNFYGSPELAIHQTLRFDNYKDLKITAVFEDLQDNVCEKFDYIINWEFFVARNQWVNDWHNSGPTTFVKLREHTSVETVNKKIQHFIRNYDKKYSSLDRLELGLQPYREAYLHSNFKNGYISGGRIEYVRLFELVALFVLLIACINFTNLSTARSLRRAREIGVRKVIGADKRALISQFMIEAILYTFIATVFSMMLFIFILPKFNELTGKNIVIPFQHGWFWAGIVGLTLVTALLAGSYPSFLMSSFKPIVVLKKNVAITTSSGFFRKAMVVTQFALSMIFIVGMIVISQQVNFIQSTNLGYQKNNLIYLPISGNIAAHFDLFKQQALQKPGVTAISYISHAPVRLENTTGGVEWIGKAPDALPTFVQAAVSYDFIKTMQSTLISGRDFSPDFNDSASYIINEKALNIIGYKDPIGKPLIFWGIKGTIIGVVKDFHFNSLHVPINPIVLRLNKRPSGGIALIRIEPSKTLTTVAELDRLHKEFNPDFPISYQFADEAYASLYKSEQVVKKLSGYFAFLSIFISCLGLLGLIIFIAEQRTKEVGIRKVLGASVSRIVSLLSKDLIKLVVVSTLFSTPIAWYIMKKWLQGFEYGIQIEWWVFVVASAGAVLIAVVTVGIMSAKAALANPVNSLKSE